MTDRQHAWTATAVVIVVVILCAVGQTWVLGRKIGGGMATREDFARVLAEIRAARVSAAAGDGAASGTADAQMQKLRAYFDR